MEKLIETLQKGGVNIGFSFCMYCNFNGSDYFNIIQNKNTNK